jgi:hypothetical protein
MKPFRIRVTNRSGNISYLVRRRDKTRIRYFTAGEASPTCPPKTRAQVSGRSVLILEAKWAADGG